MQEDLFDCDFHFHLHSWGEARPSSYVECPACQDISQISQHNSNDNLYTYILSESFHSDREIYHILPKHVWLSVANILWSLQYVNCAASVPHISPITLSITLQFISALWSLRTICETNLPVSSRLGDFYFQIPHPTSGRYSSVRYCQAQGGSSTRRTGSSYTQTTRQILSSGELSKPCEEF